MPDAPRHLRPPAVAGRFYDADPARCRAFAQQVCRPSDATLPQTLHGAVVPHAGWICSARLAGVALASLARHTAARTIVITGSVHTCPLWNPALDSADAWQTPLGPVAIDHDLRRALAALAGFGTMDMAHEHEHSLEVNLPLIQAAFGEDVKIVPVMIPPVEEAAAWGRAIGRVLADWPEPTVMIASSDLTHYGPNYQFTPMGVGDEARRWAHEVNDRRLLNMIEHMQAEQIVGETQRAHNACGGGAIAATIACCAVLGASAGHVLCHSDSTTELAAIGHGDSLNSVGYAGVVFG